MKVEEILKRVNKILLLTLAFLSILGIGFLFMLVMKGGFSTINVTVYSVVFSFLLAYSVAKLNRPILIEVGENQ